MLVILNLPSPVELVITQVDDHVKKRLTSQLIKGISRVLQKLLKYFNGIIILTSFILPPAGAFSIIFTLDLNYSEFAKLSFRSSFKMLLNNCCHILSDYTLTLLYEYLGHFLFPYRLFCLCI